MLTQFVLQVSGVNYGPVWFTFTELYNEGYRFIGKSNIWDDVFIWENVKNKNQKVTKCL